MRLSALTGAAVAACVGGAAHAQTADSPGAAECELHFWGSDAAVTSTYSGVGGAVGGLLAGPRPQSSGALKSDLPPEAQADALKRLDLSVLLNMPNVRLVAEPGPVDGKAARRKGSRLSPSTAPCYAELVVDYIGYSSHITAGRKFGARYFLRRYPGNGSQAQVANGGKDVKLRLYPAKTPEDHPAAVAELSSAFGQATESFLRSKSRQAPP